MYEAVKTGIAEGGRCVSCGRRDERVLRGYVRCQACADRRKKQWQERRKAALDAKVCYYCGGKDERTESGMPSCEKCRKWINEKQKIYTENRGRVRKERNGRKEAREGMPLIV